MTDAEVRAAIREAYEYGRIRTARKIQKWIGEGAVTISADALRSEVARHTTSKTGRGKRLRDGVNPSTISYEEITPSLPDGTDPYEHLWNGELLTEDEIRDVCTFTRDTIDGSVP